MVINLQKTVDKSTGLFTMTSSLQYMPTKEDANAKFTCSVTYFGPSGQKMIQSDPVVFDVHCKLLKSIYCSMKSSLGKRNMKNLRQFTKLQTLLFDYQGVVFKAGLKV